MGKEKRGEALRLTKCLGVLEKNNVYCAFLLRLSTVYFSNPRFSSKEPIFLVILKVQARATMNVSRKYKCNIRFIDSSVQLAWIFYEGFL